MDTALEAVDEAFNAVFVENTKTWGEFRQQRAMQTTRWLAKSSRVWASRVTVV
jgi:hypothetical protein